MPGVRRVFSAWKVELQEAYHVALYLPLVDSAKNCLKLSVRYTNMRQKSRVARTPGTFRLNACLTSGVYGVIVAVRVFCRLSESDASAAIIAAGPFDDPLEPAGEPPHTYTGCSSWLRAAPVVARRFTS